MPDDWTLSTAWKRAQSETDRGGAINDAERVVYLTDSDSTHRVLWALKGRTLVAECDCAGHKYHAGWCAHVASLWWQWVRGQIVVAHLDTSREYPAPPAWLRLDDDPTAFDQLTPAELDAYLTCDLGSLGVREYARLSGRSPGTVGNLLGSARDEMEGPR
ncbi:hypothetical protein GCM10009006_29360 [Haloarcula argentinensis]|uniref:SWIM-type domain-containing protein n=2 Tax=Haloarcula argentinensis TaxID=43776 RepID=A0A830FQF6_HALAR|nr:hypothetical protein GCM10009006_29360 [Haloarcula argentinensis]